MSDIEKQLQDAGLSEREAAIYLALLKIGPSSVLGIAKKAGMKRTITYVVLDELLRQGLVSLVPKEKRKLYVALSPERLLERLARSADGLRGIMPSLLAFYRGQTDKPAIQLFESGEGILNVYREITSRKDIKSVETFFSFEAIPKEFEENYALFIKFFESGRVRGRDIISTTALEHYYLKHVRHLPNYQARRAPEGLKFFSDSIIYGNKVALFSFKKRFALIIESEDIANSLHSLYELAWQSARAL